jgi:uncharacterized protein (DUF4415 family)
MEVVPDSSKRRTNIVKHGYDLAVSRRRRHSRLRASRNRSDRSNLDATRQQEGKKAMARKFLANRPLTDEEEAEIQRMIASDPDAPEITDEQAARAKPFSEAFPELMDSIRRARGRPRIENPKTAVTLRLDPATLEKFKATGKDWRARMSEALDKAKL